MSKDTLLQLTQERFSQEIPLRLTAETASKKMTDFKDNGLPKIASRDLKAAKISLALDDMKGSKVALRTDKNHLIFAENNIQRPMTASVNTVTRKGEVKHNAVSAPLKEIRKKIRDQDNRELVVFLPPEYQSTKAQQGRIYELVSTQNELPNKFSKLSVLQPLNEMKASLVAGQNTREKHKDKNIKNNTRELIDVENVPNVLPRLSKSQQTRRLPLIGERALKRTFESKLANPRALAELENHLKKADQEYDEYMEKASLLFNWISCQNKLKERTANI